jgi:hypothetical protein
VSQVPYLAKASDFNQEFSQLRRMGRSEQFADGRRQIGSRKGAYVVVGEPLTSATSIGVERSLGSKRLCFFARREGGRVTRLYQQRRSQSDNELSYRGIARSTAEFRLALDRSLGVAKPLLLIRRWFARPDRNGVLQGNL